MVVKRLDNKGQAVRKRAFFSKAKLQDGAASSWLVRKKEEDLLAEIAQAGPYTEEHFMARGLRAKG